MTDFTNAFGIPEDENLGGGLGSFAYGGGTYVATEAPALTLSSSQSVFIEGVQAVQDTQPAYIFSTGSQIASKPLYIGGGGTSLDTQQSFTHGHVSVSDAQPGHIGGHYALLSSQPFYLNSTGAADNFIPAFVHGDRLTIDSFKTCYLSGGSVSQVNIIWSNWNFAYINGSAAPTISSTKLLFIVSYGLIGDWNLDDGITDPFKNTADDEAMGNTMLFTDRSPTWIPGPHCGGEL